MATGSQSREVLRVKQWLKLTAIALFLIVDIVAAAFVIRHVNERPASEGSSLAVPTGTPSTTSATAEPSSEGPTGLVVSGNLVARFTKGSCDDPSRTSLELSTNQAANFTEIALPLEAKPDANGDRNAAVTSIVDVALKSPTELTMIGTDTDCRTYTYATKDGGEDWKRADTAGSWFVDKDQVGAPGGGMVDPECEAFSVWPISDRNARVGCKDGQIRGTDDAGETWVGLGFLKGLTAVTFSTIRDGIGIADDGACASLAYSTGSAGNEWEPLGCIDKNKRAAAIGGTAGLFVALVEGDVYVSTDQGRNWEKR